MAKLPKKKFEHQVEKKRKCKQKLRHRIAVFSFLGFILETYRSMTTAGSPSLQRPSRNRVYSQVMKKYIRNSRQEL